MDDRKRVWYEVKLEKRDGSVVIEKRCKICDVKMDEGSWIENRAGVLYKVTGMRCPRCNAKEEKYYNMIGPA